MDSHAIQVLQLRTSPELGEMEIVIERRFQLWHTAAYLILFFGVVIELPIQGSDDETDRPQAIADIWEDLPVLHKLQQGIFSLFILTMERDQIGHQITKFRWENGFVISIIVGWNKVYCP